MAEAIVSQASRKMAHNLDDLRERWINRRLEDDVSLVHAILKLPDKQFGDFLGRMTRQQASDLEVAMVGLIQGVKADINTEKAIAPKCRNVSNINRLERWRARIGKRIQYINRHKPPRKDSVSFVFAKLVKPYLNDELYEQLWSEAKRLAG